MTCSSNHHISSHLSTYLGTYSHGLMILYLIPYNFLQFYIQETKFAIPDHMYYILLYKKFCKATHRRLMVYNEVL